MEKPHILTPGSFGNKELGQLRQQNKIWKEVDIHNDQLHELYEITHPDGDDSQFKVFAEQQGSGDLAGSWVYYPWSGVLLHCLGEEDLFTLRTNRNRNLVTIDEQQKLARSTVAVAGMSVGSGIALACVFSGIANTIKIADFDKLETANLNRLSQGLVGVGQSKVHLTAQQIYELNPFATVQQFNKISEDTISDFFHDPDVAVVIDEIDDFKMKVQLRLEARKSHTALLMFTSLGDNILVDVERYDQDHGLAIFNGAIGDLPEGILRKQSLSPEDIKQYAVRLVGQQYIPTKAMGSLLDIGKTLVGRPQLYATVAVDGGLAAYLVRSIILGAPLKSGRYFIKFSELFSMASTDLLDSTERQDILHKLMKQ